MPKFLIDSDIIIWYLRGRKDVIALLEELQKSGVPACSPISIVEIQLGVIKGEEEKTSKFLNSLEVYPMGREIANLAGEYIRKQKKKGITLEIPDAIVGATCILNNLTLVTLNKKHYPFEGIKFYPIK